MPPKKIPRVSGFKPIESYFTKKAAVPEAVPTEMDILGDSVVLNATNSSAEVSEVQVPTEMDVPDDFDILITTNPSVEVSEVQYPTEMDVCDDIVVLDAPNPASCANQTCANESPLLPESVDERNDIGFFIGKINSLSDMKKFQLLNNHWQPQKNYSFPFSVHKQNEKRYFNRKYLDEYHWLVFSDKDKGLYCKFCALFASDNDMVKVGALVNKALTKFAKLTGADGSLSSHSTKKYHEKAVQNAQDFIARHQNPSQNISNQLSHQRQITAQQNREKLRPTIKTIILCGKQNMSLRGHRDDGNVLQQDLSKNDGNFRALLRFRVDAGDTVLEKHLRDARSNATYTSKTIQNALIECCRDEIQAQILERVRTSGPYSVLFDETTDVNGIEQMSLSFRYVYNGQICEDFICFLDCYKGVKELYEIEGDEEIKLTGEALGRLVASLILKFNLDPLLCVGAGVDSCIVMASEVRGAVVELKKTCKNIKRCPCFNHSLNNSLAQTSKVPQARNAIALMKSIIRFCNASAKRKMVFRKHLEKDFSGLCETRWCEKHDGILQFSVHLAKILNALEEVSSWSHPKTANDAKALILAIDSEFIVAVCSLSTILSITKPLSLLLQAKSLDLNSANTIYQAALSVLKEMRHDAEGTFTKIFKNSSSLSTSIDLQLTLPRMAKQQRFRANHPVTDIETYFRVSLFIPLVECILYDMSNRLPEETLSCFNLYSILPFHIKNGNDGMNEADENVVEEIANEWRTILCQNSPNLLGEFMLWKNIWKNHPEEVPIVMDKIISFSDPLVFPAIHTVLKIFGALPVSVATAERSFSALRRLKTWLRSAMAEERLTGLALLHIHYGIEINIDNIIDRFANSSARRLNFIL